MENKYMAIDIVCTSEFNNLKKFATDLEKNGFIPISMSNKTLDGRLVTCILMHKKE